MRHRLALIGVNRFASFSADIGRYGFTHRGYITQVLMNIYHEPSKQWVTDHLWVPDMSAQFKLAGVGEGDRIVFSAKVKKYYKGWGDNREMDYALESFRRIRMYQREQIAA